ncbi:MAG: hypothetical protein JO301_14470 [Chitinophagaceae bacterium]|nr:hypothetical protein [Chitinophagaceae bacterium]
MEDENIITALIYFEYGTEKSGVHGPYVSKDLDGYKVYNKINFRVRSKNEISKVMESAEQKAAFIKACNNFEFGFIRKLKELISNSDDDSFSTLNKNLDYILGLDSGRRTQVSFYALWCIMYGISFSTIQSVKIEIRDEIRQLCHLMNNIDSKEDFDRQIIAFRNRYKAPQPHSSFEDGLREMPHAKLTDISSIAAGKPILSNNDKQLKGKVPFIKKLKADSYIINPSEHSFTLWPNDGSVWKQSLKERILIQKGVENNNIVLSLINVPAVVGQNIVSIVPTRPGFHIYYIFGILASPVAYHLLGSGQKEKSELAIHAIKNLPIPLIDEPNQVPFIRLTEYLLALPEKDKRFLFFKRLLDLIALEVFFKDDFRSAGVEILSQLKSLPAIESNIEDDKDKFVDVDKVYSELSDPAHEVMALSLKALNINPTKN